MYNQQHYQQPHPGAAPPQVVHTQAIPQMWEYMVVEKMYDPQKKLNELGAQGWELVGIDSTPTAKIGSRYVLKRPRRG
ncbi:hypothetical protein [Nocardiopsis sp. FR4]|uniref:hypothetical protein n=1 Tax=Nocardiopsis sp. FR4 TaxID=2605985 RepID=UPI00135B1958|nr:hypothetical protein [Nocardiopsis sp. FR4]